MRHKISIITICWNEEARIRRTLQSVVAQTYKNIEFIVIDGGSTDSTPEILQEYSAEIHKLVSEPDGGIYQAQNKGAALATGDYLLFLNGGDALAENTSLERLVSGAAAADIVYGDIVVDDGKGQLTPMASPPRVTTRFLLNATLWHPTTLIKRQVFSELGPYRVEFKIAADYDFFMRAFFVGKCRFQHVSVSVAIFFADGLSSRPESQNQLKFERRRIQKQYLNSMTLSAYFLAEALLSAPILGKIAQKTYRTIRKLSPSA